MVILSKFQRTIALATPQQKRIWLLVGAAGVFVLGLWALSALTPPPPKRVSEHVDTKIIAPPKRNVDLESMGATLTNVQRQLNEIQARQNMADSSMKEAVGRVQGQLQDVVAGKIGGDGLTKEVDMMVAKRIEKLKSDGSLAVPNAAMVAPPLGSPLPSDVGQGPAMPPSASEISMESSVAPKRPKLRLISESESDGEQENEAPKPGSSVPMLATGFGNDPSKSQLNAISRDTKPSGEKGGGQIWIPAGAILTGVLITGMDAPASSAAQKNPTPALVRLKFNATLPNHFQVDIKECFALVDGYGQLSSERAIMRSQRLTCVRQDGGVVEANLDGFVTGEDGKVGMRGRLITKEGALIASSLSAGVLGAFGQRLSKSTSPGVSLGQSGGGGLSIGALGNSAESGIGTAFTKVAEFYLELAKEMVPIIEIDAGRQVTIVLVRGVSIKNAKN